MLKNCVAVFNGKGGVGKTSLTANIAGLLADEAGWKVLVVDLDEQGDTGTDLGFATNAEEHDGGTSLLSAILSGEPLTEAPVRGSVPEHAVAADGVDVIPGGQALEQLRNMLRNEYNPDRAHEYSLFGAQMEQALSVIAGNYDLILFDCPPAKRDPLNYEALGCSKWLIVPTKADAGSTDALAFVAQEMAILQNSNPDLEVLGVVIFGLGSTATRLREQGAEQINTIAEMAGWSPDVLLEPFIRSSDRSAFDLRSLGVLAHQYLSRTDGQENFIPDPDDPSKRIPNPNRGSQAAGGLADDYAAVVTELVERMAARG